MPALTMRGRYLMREYWSDSDLFLRLDAGEREVYQGLWMLADDAGWMEWDASRIAAELYPYGVTVTGGMFGGDPIPAVGFAFGDVTLVEFFGYRCRYCKAVAPAVAQLLKEDPNVRLVYKDFPILGDASGRTFDNAGQEYRNVWEGEWLPLMEEFAEAVNMQLAPRFGNEVMWFETDHVAAGGVERTFRGIGHGIHRLWGRVKACCALKINQSSK